ncbi:MAG TPA: tetratricopeptide repeat protein [Terracidiphilus sp.]|nr:tetratricopeptide repeat protein [Terracidiphilus sp.]
MQSRSVLYRKSTMHLLLLSFFAGAICVASAQTTVGNELNLGVDAYKSAHYDEAIAHFQKAVDLDPSSVMAKAYLGTALSQNVVPGLATPENLKTAQQAIDVFYQVIAAEPHDVNSMKQIAGIYFNIKKLDDAKEWQKKIIDEDPSDPEAAYTIGVIDWTEAYQNALKALQDAGINDDGMGNLSAPAPVIESIRQQNAALVDEGIHYLSLAIQLRPDYDDAMQYLNLTYRRKADLDRGDDSARNADLETAKEWTEKAMATRKAKEQSQKNSAPAQP